MEGSQRWSKDFEGGIEGQTEGVEANSNWIEVVEYYDVIQHQLTLCCKVLPRLTVMSYSTDDNINSKPRCLGF